MNLNRVFSLTEDTIAAAQLILEDESTQNPSKDVYKIDKTIEVINFAAIKSTHRVRVIAPYLDTIVLPLSYLHRPQKILCSGIGQEDSSSTPINYYKWQGIRELMGDWQCVPPSFCDSSMEEKAQDQELFDLFIAGGIDGTRNNNILLGRFDLETGAEYQVFERLLVKSSQSLKEAGVLLAVARPGWILKAWKLIEELGFQLEYQNYRLYINEIRHANTYIWLKFTKTENINLEFQKRSLLALMKDNYIDRLFAHRNDLIFPYVELSYKNTDGYVDLEQNLEYLQYFFSLETTKNLAQLCEGYTACLVTPSVAQYAYNTNKNVVLFERDNRFRQNKGVRFVKYDLNTGLTKLNQNRYSNKFDGVICDPPFDISLETLARDIDELLKTKGEAMAHVVFPEYRSISLINAMGLRGLCLAPQSKDITIEYTKPPKVVRIRGKRAIQLYSFTRKNPRE